VGSSPSIFEIEIWHFRTTDCFYIDGDVSDWTRQCFMAHASDTGRYPSCVCSDGFIVVEQVRMCTLCPMWHGTWKNLEIPYPSGYLTVEGHRKAGALLWRLPTPFPAVQTSFGFQLRDLTVTSLSWLCLVCVSNRIHLLYSYRYTSLELQEAETFLRSWYFLIWSRNSLHFMEPTLGYNISFKTFAATWFSIVFSGAQPRQFVWIQRFGD
jgi:hypothetical protein